MFRAFRFPILALVVLGLAATCFGQQSQDVRLPKPAPLGKPAENSKEGGSSPQEKADDRTKLNLVGQTDTQSGENRRNDNVQLTPLDNNVLKELNQRIGTTATIVREFTADRSYYGSEYGNPPSTPVHVQSPRPFAGLHGSVFASHLNSVFSARSFFQVGDVGPGHENNYGFDLSAPLWRRAQLSIQGNQQKNRKMVNGNVLVPLANERTALAQDPVMHAYIQRILDAYPRELPNRTDIDPRMLNTNSPQTVDGSTGGAQFSQGFGTKDLVVTRYLYVTQKVDAFQFLPGNNPDSTTRSHQARVTWTHRWTPSDLTDLSFGYDRLSSLVVPEPNNIGPYINTGGLSPLGTVLEVPIDRIEKMFRPAAQWRHEGGRYAFSLGFEWVRRQFDGVQSGAKLGHFFFRNDFGNSAITNLRLGQTSIGFKGFGNTERRFRSLELAGYFTGSWAATRSLSVNYGVRYQPSPAPYEVDGRTTIPYSCDCNNFAPRLGLAYRLPGKWGVLRAGYGLQYGSIHPAIYSQLRYNPPDYKLIVLPQPNIVNPVGGTELPSAIFVFDSNFVSPYTHSYNLSWEGELGAGWKVQVGYAGSRTFKLIEGLTYNRGQTGPGMDLTSGNVNDRRPNPNYSEIYFFLNTGRGWFDAGKVTLLVPRWRGLSFETSYWISKAIDLGANYSDLATQLTTHNQWEFEAHQDLRQLSTFDQPHSWLTRFAYDLPKLETLPNWLRAVAGGWNLTGVILLKQGTPFSVQSGSDSPGFGNVDGVLGDRPDVADTSVLGRTIGNPDTSKSLLPKSAFRFIQPGTLRGNLANNTFRKGSIRTVNAAISRAFSLGGDRRLRFRAESVNFLNTPQFAAPVANLTDPSFGVITNTLNEGRTFRFGVNFEF